MLQWSQWLWEIALKNRRTICINFDETPVYRQLQPRKGYVLAPQRQRDKDCYARVPLRDRRGASTVLALICDDAELQKTLPQFILTKDKNLTKAEMEKLKYLPAPLRWVKGTKGWVTSPILIQLLTEMRKCIRRTHPHHEIVVCFDCAPCHVSRETLIHCSRLQLHVCLIPGGMTYLCQPLDTHVFATFKRHLAEAQERERESRADGVLPATRWVDLLARTVLTVLTATDWSHTFAENGLAASWVCLRSRIAEQVMAHLPLPLREPSLDELNLLLGSKREDIADLVYRQSKRTAARPVLLIPAPLARLPAAPPLPAIAAGAGAAASSSGAALPPPPLPPPADPHPEDPHPARITRSGSRY